MSDAGLNANKRLLDVLARSGLLPADLLSQIRAQVNKSAGNVDPKSVVKFLVSKGKITAEQATTLLAEIAAAKPAPLPAAPPAAIDDDLLDLAGFVDQPAPQAAAEKSANPPARSPAAQPPRKTAGSATRPAPRPADDELPPLGAADDPLGGLQPLDDLLGAPLDQLEASAAEAPDPLQIARRPRRGGAWWDTPWLPLGIGAAIAVALTAGIVVKILNRPTGDDELRSAQARYDEQNYAEALTRYDQFLQEFPSHPLAGQAEVQRDLAALRVATSASAPDWSAVLAAAEKIAPRVRAEAQALELLRMAPGVVEGLARPLESGGDAAQIDAARRALALFAAAPLSRQPVERLNDARRTIGLAERRLARSEKLAATRQAIQAAASAADAEAALTARRVFLRDFPESPGDAELSADLAPLAAALIAKVEPSPLKPTPLADESLPGAHVLALTTSAAPTAKPLAPSAQRIALRIDGTVYAFDPDTGRLAWRRFLGVDSAQQPLAVADAAGGGVIVVDSVRNEVLRLAADTGRLIWRLPVALGAGADEAAVAPRLFVAAGDGTLLIATSLGDLLRVEPGEGKVVWGIRLPQNISAPPAIHAGNKIALQLAEEALAYVVALADGKCVQAVVTGHESGAASFAPVWFGDQAAIVENDRSASARVRLLTLDEKTGRVAAGQDLRGEARVVCEPRVATAGPTKRLWLASPSGRNYVVETSGSDPWQWSADPDGARRGAAIALGRTEQVELVVRRRAGGGLTAVGFNLADSGELWRTELAVPLLGGPVVASDGAKLRVFDRGGSQGEWQAADIAAASVRDQPAAPTPREHVPGSDREWTATPFGASAALFAPREGIGPAFVAVAQAGAAQWRPLSTIGTLTAPPVARKNGAQWVGATSAGQVVILDAATAAPLAGEPWRFPAASADSSDAAILLRPTVTADDDVIVTDGRTKICRVTLGGDPAPKLATAATADVPVRFVAPPVAIEKIVFAATDDNQLLVFRLPDLKAGPKTPLPGRCILGPEKVGDLVFVGTDQDQLLCFNGKEQLRWTLPLADGPLVGPPVVAGDLVLLVSLAGRVTPIDRAGKAAGRALETGLTPAAPPVRYGDYLLLTAPDGAIHALPLAAFRKPTGK